MRKIVLRNADGSLTLDAETVRQVAGQAPRLVIQARPGMLTLAPQAAPVLSDAARLALGSWAQRAGLPFLERFREKASSGPSVFQGDLSVLSLSDVLMFLATGRKTGGLFITLDNGNVPDRAVFFREGQLIRVASRDAEEQLPHFLVRRQAAAERDLELALAGAEEGPGLETRLAVQAGLTPAEMTAQTVQHEESLLFEFFNMESGAFVFADAPIPAEAVRRFPLGTQNYVMDAARVRDETSRLQAALPPPETILVTRVHEGADLQPEEQALLELAGTGRPLAEVVRASPVERADTLRLLGTLLKTGLLRAVDPNRSRLVAEAASRLGRAEREAIQHLFSAYNDVFQMILQSLSVEKGERATLALVDPFFKGPARTTVLAGVEVSVQDALLLDDLLPALATVPADERPARMISGLNELLYFLVFAVKDNLGADVERGIVKTAMSLLEAHKPAS